DAADAAFAKFNRFRDWIDELAAGWAKYTAAAKTVADAHTSAVTAHHPIWQAYDDLQRDLDDELSGASPDQDEVDRILKAMEAEEQKSVDVRETYAQKAGVDLAPLPDPPFGVREGVSEPAGVGGRGGSGGGAGGGADAAGSPSGMPEGQPAMSPASLDSAAGQPQTGSPAAAGAPSGAGTPSGAGSPSGGGAPAGGMPAGVPKLTEPNLKPASTGGGGAGAGGAGGGGAVASPLGPAVAAETVAPGAAAARSGAAPIGAAAGGGAMMGGMGGPMMGGMGGQGQNQNKDKRRDPRLAAD